MVGYDQYIPEKFFETYSKKIVAIIYSIAM